MIMLEVPLMLMLMMAAQSLKPTGMMILLLLVLQR